MANGKYGNTDSSAVKTDGTFERVTIAANVGQGTDQTCAVVILQQPAGNTGSVRVRVGATATSSTGIEVAEATDSLRLEVENTNLLYFYSGTNGDVVDIQALS